MISLRRASAGDRAVILRMILDERLDPTTLNWRNFNVAEVNGEIAGIAQVKPYADCREFGSLAVLPQFRQQGVGAALIEAALAQEQGDVYLLCRDERVPYYGKFGFQVIQPDDAPGTLRRKLSFAKMFRMFGVRVACMKHLKVASATCYPGHLVTNRSTLLRES